jgi:hypothetical protein
MKAIYDKIAINQYDKNPYAIAYNNMVISPFVHKSIRSNLG